MARHDGVSPPKLTDAERTRIGENARAILERELHLTFGREDGRGWSHALCPLHDEKTPSFGVRRDGAIRCYGCGFSGDVIDVLEKALGCSRGEAIQRARGSEHEAPTRRRPGPPPSPDAKTNNNGSLVAPVPDDAPPLPRQRNEVARYAYSNAAGRVLLYVVRIEPGGKGPGSKDCIPWTLRRFSDGRTVWRPTLQGFTTRPLYGRETLEKDGPVLFVEGEKAADAARRLWPDLAVVTTIGGAGQESSAHELEALAGRDVVFWPDHDTPGDKYAHALARRVLEAGARRAVVVDVPPQVPEKWDLADVGPDLPAEKARELIDAALSRPVVSVAEDVTRDADGSPWEDFDGFDRDPVAELPDMDLDLLPPVIQDAARAVASFPKSDPAMAAGALLAGVGAAAALKCSLRVGTNAKPVFSNLAVLIVGDVAEGKSSAINEAGRAASAAIKDARADQAPAVRKYEQRKMLLEVSRKEAIERYKGNRDERIEAEIEQIDRELDALEPVFPLAYMADDITPEQLPVVMYENNGRAFVCAPEPGFFANLSGRYDAQKNGLQKLENPTNGLTNEPVRVKRGNRTIDVELTALSLAVGMHPETLSALRKTGQMVERGLFSRMLFINAKPRASTRRFADLFQSPEGAAAKDRYRELVRSLTRMPIPDGMPLLTPDIEISWVGLSRYEKFFDEMHEQIAPDGAHTPIKGWATRVSEVLQRLVLTMHCALHGERFRSEAISGDTMSAAMALMHDYFLPHAIHAHHGGAIAGNVEDARYLARRWFKLAAEKGNRVFLLSELTEGAERFRIRTSAIRDPLAELERRGIARRLSKQSGTPGRPGERWELHPGFRPED